MTSRHPLRLAVLVVLVVAARGRAADRARPSVDLRLVHRTARSPSVGAASSAARPPAASAAPSGAATASGPPAPSRLRLGRRVGGSIGLGRRAGGRATRVVGTKPCPESRFECVTLAVPKDHFAAAGGDTWNVTFAIQRAAKARKGTFVVITGGPGYSGIASADDYTDYYAAGHHRVLRHRLHGPARHRPVRAHPVHQGGGDLLPVGRPPVGPGRARPAAADAETFAKDCIAEAGVAEADLPLYATKQAVEDLEAVRDYLGADKLHLYGESYGTQYVQTYAAAYPDRVETLYLDGPVDLTVDGPTLLRRGGAERRGHAGRRRSMPARAEALQGRRPRRRRPRRLRRPRGAARRPGRSPSTSRSANGTTEQRELTASALENGTLLLHCTAAGARALLQRAIAAASHDDFVPLAKLYYDSLSVDPDTLAADRGPDLVRRHVLRGRVPGLRVLPDGRRPGRPRRRLGRGRRGGRHQRPPPGDLATTATCRACTGRARRRPTTGPAPLVDTPYPVFVLTSTTDPATPIANGMRIYSRLDDAYFFQARRRPARHLRLGRGLPGRPDDRADRRRDAAADPGHDLRRRSVADAYVPNAALAKADYDDALDLMQSMDDQILNSDDYAYRLDADPITAGCDYGGTITYTPTDTRHGDDADRVRVHRPACR